MARTILRRRTGDIVTALQVADRTGIVAASAPPAAEEPAVEPQRAAVQPVLALGRVAGSQFVSEEQPESVGQAPHAGSQPSAGPRSQPGGSELVGESPSGGPEPLGWAQRSRAEGGHDIGEGRQAVAGSRPESVVADSGAGAQSGRAEFSVGSQSFAGSEPASGESGPSAGPEPAAPGTAAGAESVARKDAGQVGLELVAGAQAVGPGARRGGAPSGVVAVPGSQVAIGAQ
ncbi:hypothetical protein GKO32_37130, partial [Amycolatopsis sp. RM579]|nr:hypothetical protein [Amycolatopsis pithecellobii]